MSFRIEFYRANTSVSLDHSSVLGALLPDLSSESRRRHHQSNDVPRILVTNNVTPGVDVLLRRLRESLRAAYMSESFILSKENVE